MLTLKDFQLGQKLTLLLSAVFLGGILATAIVLSQLLNFNAQAELTNKALMLMETMNSVRDYTSTQVNPELKERLAKEFLPESVPAYSAREVFEAFRKSPTYNDFFYKEAALNPTNVARDKADAFETKLIEGFRQKSSKASEVSGFRSSSTGNLFYIARPITIQKASCLECHSTPDKAPASMIKLYGPNHGFGWQLNETIGAQVISVPAAKVLNTARRSLLVLLGIFTVAFALATFLVNLWLKRYVVRPINRMALTAEAVSMGDTAAEFVSNSNDEVGKLTEAFNRLRLSLQMAMQRLEKHRRGGGNTSPSQ
jgi:HAMP domain-containing protein